MQSPFVPNRARTMPAAGATFLALLAASASSVAQPRPAGPTAPPTAPPPSQPAQPATVAVPMPPPPPLTPEEASGEHFTLLDALTALSRAHPLLIAAESTNRAAEYDAVQAGLWTNPQANGSWTYSLNNNAAGYSPAGYFTAGVSQFLELAGVPGARRRVAEFILAATRAESDGVHRTLNYDVRTAFVALASGYARLQVLRETLVELERAEAIVRARVNAGAAPHYDASRIAVALADARSAVNEAEADLIDARGTLDVAVGPLAASLHGTPVFDLFAEPPLPAIDQLLDVMRTTRPDIVAARRQADAAEAQVGVARRSVFQGIAVSVGAGYGSGSTVDMNNVQHVSVDLGVGVSIPIPVLDRGQGAIPAAEARYHAAVAGADAIQLADEQRVRSNYNELQRRRQALQSYRETGAAESAGMQREAEAGYREGRLSVLELVDAYIAVRDARLRYLSLATAARNTEVDLGRAIGALDPAMRAPGTTLPIPVGEGAAGADGSPPGANPGGAGATGGGASGNTGGAGASGAGSSGAGAAGGTGGPGGPGAAGGGGH